MIDRDLCVATGFLTERITLLADAASLPQFIYAIEPGGKTDASSTLFLKNHRLVGGRLADVYRTAALSVPADVIDCEVRGGTGPLASLAWASTSPAKLSQAQAEDAGTMQMTSLELVFGARRTPHKMWEATIGAGPNLTHVGTVSTPTEALALAQAAHGHAWWERYRNILIARLGDLTWGVPIETFRKESSDPKSFAVSGASDEAHSGIFREIRRKSPRTPGATP